MENVLREKNSNQKFKNKNKKQKQQQQKQNKNNKTPKKQYKIKQNKTKLNKFLTPIIMIMLNKQIYSEKKNTFQTFLESAGLSQQPMSAEQT